MTSVSKDVYIDKLDDIANKFDTYHSTIQINLVDVNSRTYIDSSKENNEKDPKFKFGDVIRISKYKNIFAKAYSPNQSGEHFMIKKVKNTVPWTYVINDLNGKKIIGTFYEKELRKANQRDIKNEEVMKNGDKLYVKQNGYNNSFNCWMIKKIQYK